MKSGIAALSRRVNTVFTVKELASIWGIVNYDYLKTRIRYYVKAGYLERICQGLYIRPGSRIDRLEAGNKLRNPSYVSFQTVLVREGMMFQQYGVVFLASYCSAKVDNGAGSFVYHRLRDAILYADEGIIRDGAYCIACRERAFLDILYIYKDLHIDNLRPLDWERVDTLLPLYESKTLTKRAERYRRHAG